MRISIWIASFSAVCTSWSPADILNVPADFPTVQSAIEAAADGDTVAIEAGTYLERGLSLEGKQITLSGELDADGIPLTILDGDFQIGTVIICDSGEGPTTVIENLMITNALGVEGGALSCIASSPTVRRCVFVNNASPNGGAVFCQSSAPSLENCSFRDNTGTIKGGGLYATSSQPSITKCFFQDNRGIEQGGAIWCTNSNAQISESTFELNSSPKGGGLYASSSQPSITDCLFQNNLSTDQGAAIWCTTSNAQITQSTFDRNTAPGDGGAVRLINNSFTTFLESTFTGNTAGSGGGLCTTGSSPLLVDCRFEGNSATLGGGLFITEGSQPILSRCVILDNEVVPDGAGGGIAVGLNSSPVFNDCVFEGNSVRSGRGSGGNWSGPFAGGGLIVYESDAVLTNCRMIGNVAPLGGAAYVVGSSLTANSCVVENNNATILGGGFRVFGDQGIIHLSNSNFTSNIAQSLHGGAICAGSSSTVAATGLILANNNANNSGGAIFGDTNSRLLIQSSLISGNSAGVDGGGFFSYPSPGSTLTDCTVTDNSAENRGGGVYSYDSALEIRHCRISANTAGDLGGGMFVLLDGTPTVGDTIFCGNTVDDISGQWNDDRWNLFWTSCNDCNANGIVDSADILNGTSLDVDGDAIPDDCEYDCDEDGTPDPVELFLGEATDIDGDTHPDNCQPDCNQNLIPDEYEIETGLVGDCDGNMIPDQCDLEDPLADCDGNGTLDDCQPLDDVTDCNGDGLIDSCVIEEFPILDCNQNGILDSCDLQSGSSNDVNQDLVPDECQCLSDLDGNALVNVDDLLVVISQFGDAGIADMNLDGIVDIFEVLQTLAEWGDCGSVPVRCVGDQGALPPGMDANLALYASSSDLGQLIHIPVQTETISRFRAWGMFIEYPAPYLPCEDPETVFTITTYSDDGNDQPGTVVAAVDILSDQQFSGRSFALFGYPTPLIQLDFPIEMTGDIRWVSLDSQETSQGCIFGWIGTILGEGQSVWRNADGELSTVDQGFAFCLTP